MKLKPLKEALTVYRAMSTGFKDDQFTNEDNTYTTTDRSVLEGLGEVVSIELPAGTMAAIGGEDGEVMLDKGLTFRRKGNSLELVSEQETTEEQEHRQVMSGITEDVRNEPPPAMPTSISEFLDQIEYIEPIDPWEQVPETDDDGEEAETLFGVDFGDWDSVRGQDNGVRVRNGDGDLLGAGERPSPLVPSGPKGSTPAASAAAAVDLAPITARIDALSQALANNRPIDLAPLIEALGKQPTPQIVVQPQDLSPIVEAIKATQSTPQDLSPVIKALANLRGEAFDYKALALALSKLPAPQVTVAPVDNAPLADALLKGLSAQAEAIRSMPAPQVTVAAPAPKEPLRDIKFDFNDKGDLTGASLQ